MKPKGSLKYFNNSILKVNDTIHSGFLNGTNNNVLCFKCTYDCGYCNNNSIDEYERCLNPHCK